VIEPFKPLDIMSTTIYALLILVVFGVSTIFSSEDNDRKPTDKIEQKLLASIFK